VACFAEKINGSRKRKRILVLHQSLSWLKFVSTLGIREKKSQNLYTGGSLEIRSLSAHNQEHQSVI